MTPTIAALTDLFNRIPRRHSLENVVEINSIVNEYKDHLIYIEGLNAWYEKNTSVFFAELEEVVIKIKKSTDNKVAKKSKDAFFDEASGMLKDSIEALMIVYKEGERA